MLKELSRIITSFADAEDATFSNSQMATSLPEIIECLTDLVNTGSPSAIKGQQFFQLLKQAVISGFEAYPDCSITLAESLGKSIFYTIAKLTENEKTTQEFTAILSDVCEYTIFLVSHRFISLSHCTADLFSFTI